MKGLGIDRATAMSFELSLFKTDCRVRSCNAIVLTS